MGGRVAGSAERAEGRVGWGDGPIIEGRSKGVARAGVAVDETIACVGVGAGEAADRLLELSAASGQYRAVGIGADRFQFARTFRPTWAIVCAVLFVWAAGLGLLFLLVKTTETWVATIEQDHRSTRIRVTGNVLPSVLVAVRSALQGEQQRPAAAPTEFTTAPVGGGFASAGRGAPALLGPPPGFERPAPPPAPLLAPPSPSAQPVALAPQQSAPLPAVPQPVAPQPVVPQPAVPQPVAPQPAVPQAVASVPVVWLELDTGGQLQLQQFTLIGRDPAPSPGDPPAMLVPVEDESRSVSKTHVALDLADVGVRVMDRHSTNGTSVDGPGGAVVVTPDHPLVAGAGSVIRFGDRWMRVHVSDGSGAG